MNILLYILLFITGSFFGSFFTLAVYRIPRKEDIFIKHSYCPNCTHKLGFFDLFPIFSYLFLKGKCRYCGNKIRPRYFLLEIFSGISFTFVGWSLGVSYDASWYVFLSIMANLLFTSILFIIAGIDKEHHQIQMNVLIVGFVLEFVYIIYQCASQKNDVYPYVIYVICMTMGLVLHKIILHQQRNDYTISILLLGIYVLAFMGFNYFFIIAILSGMQCMIVKLLFKKEKPTSIGFYICINSMIVLIITNVYRTYLL